MDRSQLESRGYYKLSTVLVDETYEFGECENCMDDEDEAESSNGSTSGAGLDTEDDSAKIAAILGNLDRSQLESRGNKLL